MRDHEGTAIDSFNGLFDRGDPENTPLDHFQACNNVKPKGQSILSREGISVLQDVQIQPPLQNIRRIYNFPQNNAANSLIILTYDPTGDTGNIYHWLSDGTVYGPVYSATGMKDFAFVPYAGRGYISAFGRFSEGDQYYEKGLDGELLQVYMGDGTNARAAAGDPITGNMTVAAGAAGHTDAGLHIYGVVSETNSGYLTPPGALTTFTNVPNQSVSFGNIPTSGDPNVVRRHIVASKAITNYNGDPEGYQLYFIPNATINDNTSTFLNNISFFDIDLLDDASHLFDNYSEIPAGAVLTLYHNRLVLAATFDDANLAIVSQVGEPEAISQVDGLLAVQPNGMAVSNAAEFRDVLYIFKATQSMSFTDNGDEPATWPLIIVDAGLGTRPHGIATVMDSGNQMVDFLIICTYQGVSLFTGGYQVPELSWKIEDLWKSFDRNDFGFVQVVNNAVKKRIYIVTPDREVLVGFYQNGMNPKDIQWAPWNFVQPVNTMAIIKTDTDILGCDIY